MLGLRALFRAQSGAITIAADRADILAALPGVDHGVVAVADMPRFYDRALAMPDRVDEPASTEMDLARYATMMGRAARHEPRMHLNGFGGDEALQVADDSCLERLGILDVAELRRIFSRPLPPDIHPALFDATASCERWLRVQAPARSIPERRAHEHQAA